jgi:two-component system response regulator AlgR
MNILLVDDEAPARARLAQLIAELPEHRVVGEAESGAQALTLCAQMAVDVVLLDIRMPGLDGLETARLLKAGATAPAVIFVTAYADHALAAFEVQASDYLVKPVRRERLIQALARLQSQASSPPRVSNQAAPALVPAPRAHLCARLGNMVRMVAVEHIRYFKAEQKYVTVRNHQEELLIEDSLVRLQAEFIDRFIRVHRNALVAIAYLEALHHRGGQHWLQLKDCPKPVAVSRRHLRLIRQMLKNTRD